MEHFLQAMANEPGLFYAVVLLSMFGITTITVFTMAIVELIRKGLK